MGGGGRGEEEEEGEEMACGIMTEKEVELTRVSLGMEEWVAVAGAASLRALGFVERRGEWQRSEFE